MIRLIKDTIIVLVVVCLWILMVSGLNITTPSYIAFAGWGGGVIATWLIERGTR